MGASKAKYYLFTGDPIDGKTAYEWGWASQAYPADELEAKTEAVARQIALSDPVLLMMMKRNINRQIELQGFKTGMSWSMDVHSAGMRGASYASQATDFWKQHGDGGLRSAVDWRDEHFGIEYPAKD
jgi:enoyl-CoA hydratase